MLLTDDVPCPRVYLTRWQYTQQLQRFDPVTCEQYGYLELYPGAPLLLRWAGGVHPVVLRNYRAALHLTRWPNECCMHYPLSSEKMQELLEVVHAADR